MKPLIRAMDPVDLKEVMPIEESSFTIPWSQNVFMKELKENTQAFYLVALMDERLVAYLGSWIFISDSHLTTLAVHPSFRRGGIASQLLKYYFQRIFWLGVKRISLEVRGSNIQALRLYRLMGFVQVGIRKNYYHDNQEDALVLSLEL